MGKKINQSFISELTKNMLKNKHVHGAVFCVENHDATVSYLASAGDLQPDSEYFVASVTKLYITALMIILRNENKLSFDDKIHKYFDDGFIDKIHVLDGIDYSNEITIEHLLSNASGLPDYFFYEKVKSDAADKISFGNDEPWPLEKVVQRVKTLKPKFKPGQKGKVNYSDTNYQLMGAIIEKVTGLLIGDVMDEYLIKPLKLEHTYAYKNEDHQRPVLFYHKDQQVYAPNYIASITAEGGIVSTARDSMVFLKAFFNGFYFSKETIDELKVNWRMIYFPGQFFFGLGIEKLWVPFFLSPFKPIKEILGFWGQTGAFAFYNPETELNFTGTINQVSGLGHGAAFNAVIKTIKAMM